MEWIIENKEWIFSGIGVFILGLIVTLIKRNNSSKISQKQKSGDNSLNYQSSGDINITKEKNE